jgi:hypothetical protein
MNLHARLLLVALAVLLVSFNGVAQSEPGAATRGGRLCIAGIYPHLAMYNTEGECGTGAVVPWAGRLWVVTYAPHKPMGSSDKLYEITPSLEQIIRPESIGGTPANRMIHRESDQLIIGPYFIDGQRNVRVVDYKKMPGRPTGTARHLTDPAGKVYVATMEEGLYEVDVETLAVKCWINDGNANRGANVFADALHSKLPGYHGKGLYTGRGALFYSNNGERGQAAKTDPTTRSGALAMWGGPGEDWQLIEREQYVEITGPGGIDGNANPDTNPIWALGWDHRSVLLHVLDRGEWHRFRLPKASFSYDGAHGWNTEWPRIREIGQGDSMLATMHGTFWDFPKTFSASNTAGIRPRSNYLKVVGDFARWGDYVVMGCDDSAKSEFLNKRAFKSHRGAPMVSNSNLWFVKPDELEGFGPALGSGGVWERDDVSAGTTSDPYLFAGYDHRVLHVGHESNHAIRVSVEVDRAGNGQWTELRTIDVPANGSVSRVFDAKEQAQWVRLRIDKQAEQLTAWFHYAEQDSRTAKPDSIFAGIATHGSDDTLGGVMRGLGIEQKSLGLIAQHRADDDRPFYELDATLGFKPSDATGLRGQTWAAAQPAEIPVRRDGNSILVEEDGKRWRLPITPGYKPFEPYGEASGRARVAREVATERDMLNVGGTFYELPARNAGGFQHARPIASHPFAIHDFCSYRGLILITGVERDATGPRLFKSEAGDAAVWAGVVDELWRMGKPVGVGGPWTNSVVKAGEPSDPYLMYGYDKKRLTLAADAPTNVTVQIDPTGTGVWMGYKTLRANAARPTTHAFPAGFGAHWVRFIADADATVTAELVYE